VKKQQIFIAVGGIVLLVSLFILGTNVSKKEAVVQRPISVNSFVFADYLLQSKKTLSKSQQDYLNKAESVLSAQRDNNQRLDAYSTIADFWKDSVHNTDLYVYYVAERSKLVKSEKNLTFAAQLMFESLRNEQNAPKRNWKADQAIELFEKAIELDPANVDLKVGLASCYVFGKGMTGDAQQTMKGVQQLLQIVQADSTNMKAQLMLGIAGVVSTQYDKAIQRLQTVILKQPENLEAISWLADAYADKGDKENAVKWYNAGKKLVNNPEYSREIDERIKMLK
jgi:tetratricopeptide (TPR) repeat protein